MFKNVHFKKKYTAKSKTYSDEQMSGEDQMAGAVPTGQAAGLKFYINVKLFKMEACATQSSVSLWISH